MIRSMTGFGAGRGAAGGEELDVEVRSVNHKFCEVKARLPRELSALEIEVTRTVKDRLSRGGVDVSVRRAAARQTVDKTFPVGRDWSLENWRHVRILVGVACKIESNAEGRRKNAERRCKMQDTGCKLQIRSTLFLS